MKSMCQACHLQQAVVRLTQITGDDVTTLHLCSKCAAERGIETETEVSQTPLGAFLAAMGNGSAQLAVAASSDERCDTCGGTLADFRASGRMGCAACWTLFERPLRDLLRRLHGATRHTGESYVAMAGERLPEPGKRQPVREDLREALRLAIEHEHFERAAELRDQLRVMDSDDRSNTDS